jgi:hypothetical protein
MTSKRVCAFCPQTANLTGEHLFAGWIDRLLTKTTSHYVFTERDPINSSVRRFGGRHLNRTFKCVCADCNNGWMSGIDNAARNALKDVILYQAPVSFLASGIKSIARFALKNAFVADYMHHKPFFSAHQRGQFKQDPELPPGVFAWMGGVATERRKRHGIYKARYGEPQTGTEHGVKVYVFTWSAESLLLQLVAARWTNPLDFASGGWPQLSQDSQSNGFMHPLWPMPLERHVMWPPQSRVSQDDLEEIANRFKKVNLVLRPI